MSKNTDKTKENHGQDVPLNAIRAFMMIARQKSVPRAAKALGTTQSSVSRYLAVLKDYLMERGVLQD